jgi:radical SAM protein with 4Fe4S-binding SPASM domain
LDKKIIQRIKYAKSKKLKRVKIFSNGSLLTEAMSEALIKAGLDEIKISFDGANKVEFERIRYPLRFDSIINNVRKLIEIRDKLKSPLKVEIACSSTSAKTETMVQLENCVDKFSFGKLHNWGDSSISSSDRSRIRKPCSRIWRTFTVLSDGRVSLCCIDYDGKTILGDMHESSIAEIWKKEPYNLQRNLHTQAEQHKISICKHCSKSFV